MVCKRIFFWVGHSWHIKLKPLVLFHLPLLQDWDMANSMKKKGLSLAFVWKQNQGMGRFGMFLLVLKLALAVDGFFPTRRRKQEKASCGPRFIFCLRPDIWKLQRMWTVDMFHFRLGFCLDGAKALKKFLRQPATGINLRNYPPEEKSFFQDQSDLAQSFSLFQQAIYKHSIHLSM